MKLGIIGSRKIDLTKASVIVEKAIDFFTRDDEVIIISGGAIGVDTIAKDCANRFGCELVEYLPNYARFGKVAPLVRNTDIVKDSDILLAIWDGKSRGTLDTITKAKRLNKKIFIRTI